MSPAVGTADKDEQQGGLGFTPNNGSAWEGHGARLGERKFQLESRTVPKHERQ